MNKFLIDDLEKLGLWNDHILQQLKLNNGSVAEIKEIPDSLKAKYKETFEIDMKWIVNAAARRAKWVDQSMSTNIFMNTKSGKALSDVYIEAWKRGLKTTYYLRTLGASQVTKATVSEAVESAPEGQHRQGPKQQPQQEQEQQALPIASKPVSVTAALYTDEGGECEACQ